MEKHTNLGMNRTGAAMSPVHSKAMKEGALQLTPKQPDVGELRTRIEQQYLDAANQLGSVPVPATLKGMFKSTMEKATGRNPEVFINKLGQRLAFERSGARLYDAAIRKCSWLEQSGETLPFRLGELEHIRNEEVEHFLLLKQCMEEIGADPTAVTPDADVSGVVALGYSRALNDPRTTVSQCLDLLLELELADNAAWEMLVVLARDMGMDDMAKKFHRAEEQEDRHKQKLYAWCSAATGAEAGKPRPAAH